MMLKYIGDKYCNGISVQLIEPDLTILSASKPNNLLYFLSSDGMRMVDEKYLLDNPKYNKVYVCYIWNGYGWEIGFEEPYFDYALTWLATGILHKNYKQK